MVLWFAEDCECRGDRAPLFDFTWSRSGVSFTFVFLFYFFFLKKENQEAAANSSKSLMYIFTAHKLPCNGKWSRAFNGKL